MTNQFLLSLGARLIFTGVQIYCFILLKRTVPTELFNDAGLLIALIPISSLLTLGFNKYFMNIEVSSEIKVTNILFYSTLTSLLVSIPLVAGIIYLQLFTWVNFAAVFFFILLNSNVNYLQDTLRLMKSSKFVDLALMISAISCALVVTFIVTYYNKNDYIVTYFLIFANVTILHTSLLFGCAFKVSAFFSKNKIMKITNHINKSYLHLLMGIIFQTCLSTMLPIFMSKRLPADEVSRFIVEQRFQVGFLIIPSTLYTIAWPRIKSGEWSYDKLRKLVYKLSLFLVVFYLPLNYAFSLATKSQYIVDGVKLGFLLQFLSIIYTGWVSLNLNINSLYSIQLKKLLYLALTAGLLLWVVRVDLASFLVSYAVLSVIIFSVGVGRLHGK